MITRLVLIVHLRHPALMFAVLIAVIALVLVFLAPVIGVDSRPLDDRDRRGWWPGTRAR
jgi:uncharacterized membrane protein YhaH (DUF805 family)